MEIKEAILRIKEHNEIHSRKERHAVHITEALNLAALALEKQNPQELDYEADGYDENGQLIYDVARCRSCGKEFEYDINDWGCKYCSDCGQRLYWGENL